MTNIQSENQEIYSEALKALNSRKFDEVHTLIKNLFDLTPNDPTVLRYYGAACLLTSRNEDSEKCLSQIEELDIQIGLPILDFWAQLLANNLIYDKAAYLYSLFVQNDPENGHARVTYAKFLIHSKQFDKATEQLKLAMSSSPHIPSVWELDAEISLIQGNKDRAQKSALKALELNSLSYLSFQIIVSITKADPKIISTLNIEGFVKGAEDSQTPPMIRAQLNLTLGLLFEHQEDYEYAFKHYEIANNLLNGLYGSMAFTYNPKEIEEYNETLKELFGKRLLEKPLSGKTPRPIFILGMPRSGTTLVEQILGAHSKVEARGEISTLPNFANQMCSYAILDGVNDTQEKAKAKYKDLRDSYLEGTSKTPYFIDKTMTNFFHLGLIKDIFPDAIFLHIKRNKMATCFSNFVQPLSHYYVYATSLKSIKHFYARYIEMIKFWKDNLDHEIYELDYQKLVENPEDEIKNLLAHCDLGFEEACLRPEEAENPVLTLSAPALIEPINPSALTRWEHFRPYLTELT